jgi:outer membrane protein OmpA-like peptidoglycan-associated protein
MCNKCNENEMELLPELEAFVGRQSQYGGISSETSQLKLPESKVKKILNTEPIYLINVKGNRRFTNDEKSLPVRQICSNTIILDKFTLGEYTLKFHHYALLINVVNIIQASAGDPDIVLRIDGHADKSGNELRNAGLSLNRAFEVLRFLKEASLGQLPIQYTVTGFGSARPIPGADASGNRRVEIRFCKIIPPPVYT